MITTLKDLFKEVGVDTLAALKKSIFKGTECGAWIEPGEGYVVLGSIVEGSDAEATPVELFYPFSRDDFWQALESVDKEACALWEEANTEDDDDL